MASNIFDIINPNFFGVLSGKNKFANFILICDIADFFGSQIEISRKKLIENIAYQIKTRNLKDIGDDDIEEIYDENINNEFNQKAATFIKCLEKKGWLDVERDENFNETVSRTDAFIQIYETLWRLIEEETDAKEQTSVLLALYKSIINFDYKEATASIENIDLNSKALESSILSINSKIKRFINKALSDTNAEEKEILKKLTKDYQKLSAFISFHNLMTKNNPSKYRNDIINKIYELFDDKSQELILANYCVTKNLNIQNESDKLKAKSYIQDVLNSVVSQINTIESSLNIVEKRNYSYTKSSVDRINFRLNNERDIVGDINNILKGFKSLDDNNDSGFFFDIYSYNQTDNKSLYTARTPSKSVPKETEFIKHEPNMKAVAKAQQLIKESAKYSVNAINEFITTQFKENEQIYARDVNISTIEDFIKLMLIPVYSANSSSIYKIKKINNTTFTHLNYLIDDFEIIKKKGQQK